MAREEQVFGGGAVVDDLCDVVGHRCLLWLCCGCCVGDLWDVV